MKKLKKLLAIILIIAITAVSLPLTALAYRENDEYIYISSTNEENIEDIVSTFLGLSIDYDKINKELISNDSSLESIINDCKGFKITNSPKFETIVSYIISANNNVRNIQKCVNLLSERYGEKVIFEDNTYYLFPLHTS